MKALFIGIGIGFVTEVLRKWIKTRAAYKEFVRSGKGGTTTDFLLDAIILPSPYASSFGGFVSLLTSVWFATGGVITSVLESFTKRKAVEQSQPAEDEVPADMSTASLVGGGLIAGDSLAALSIGIYGLLRAML